MVIKEATLVYTKVNQYSITVKPIACMKPFIHTLFGNVIKLPVNALWKFKKKWFPTNIFEYSKPHTDYFKEESMIYFCPVLNLVVVQNVNLGVGHCSVTNINELVYL